MFTVRLGLISFFVGYIAGFAGLQAYLGDEKGKVLASEIHSYSLDEVSQTALEEHSPDIEYEGIASITIDEQSEKQNPDDNKVEDEVLEPVEDTEPEVTPALEDSGDVENIIEAATPTPKEVVPTATPTIAVQPTVSVVNAPSDLEPLFSQFANQYGVDINLLKRIADCESHFNPGVVAGPYAGMFQFTQGTWTSYRNWMGEDPNSNLRYGAREAIQTAAFAMSQGKASSLWPACSK
jgi:hypothetical protein